MNNVSKALATATLLANSSALASQVAVVDSGTFFGHEALHNQAWMNPQEIVGNMVDDDRNGLVDDVMGWNFADNIPEIFNEDFLSQADAKLIKTFYIIARIQAKQATTDETAWFKANVLDLPKDEKEAFRARLNFYGQYAHSTHCSGIVAMGNPQAKIMSARIFPDQLPPSPFMASTEGIGYSAMAAASNKMFFQVAEYLHSQKMDVANYSVGVPMEAIARKLMALTGKKNPSEAQVQAEAQKAASAFLKHGQKWIASTPETLFVIAAANDGRSNDLYPVFPAMVQAENAITVAASDGWMRLADFSNFDPKTVHIAAPGVAIRSSVPGIGGKNYLPMSGTSMATPYVTMVASTLKDANSSLKPSEMRAILIGTVDKKSWLAGKVSSEGVVNPKRAERAAELTKTMLVDDAIAQARTEVADMPEVGAVFDDASLETSSARHSILSDEMVKWARDLAQ
jgi:subtilisin family serine protease